MKKLFYQTFIKLVAIAFIPVLIANLIYYKAIKREIKKNVKEILYTKADYEQSILKNSFIRINQNIDNLLRYISLNPSNADIAVKTTFYSDKSFLKILLLNEKSVILWGISKFEPVTFNKKIHIPKDKDYIVVKNFNEFKIGILRKFNNWKVISSKFKYVYVEISLKNILRNFIKRSDDNIDYFLLDNQKRLIFHSNYNFVLAKRKYLNLFNGKKEFFKVCKIRNPIKNIIEEYIVLIRFLPEYSFFQGVEVSYDTAYAKMFQFRQSVIIESFVLIFLMGFISFFIAKSVASPVKRLQEISNEIRNGNFHPNFEDFPRNEIGILAKNLKTMAATIEADIIQIEKEKEKLDKLFNTIEDGIYVVDKDYNLTMINDRELTYINKSREDVLGKKCYKVFTGSNEKCINCGIKKGKNNHLQLVNLRDVGFRSDSEREFVNVNFINFSENEYLIYLYDVTDIIKTYKIVEEEKETLKVTLHSIGDAVIVTDEKGCITLMNSVAESLTEYKEKEALGKVIDDVFCIVDERTEEPFVSPVKKVLENGEVVNLSNHALLIGKNGSRRCIEDSAAPIMFNEKIIGVVLVFRDVTNKKKTEKEILKIEKLQTVGQLAGGIAHDFNNILTGIYGNISLAKLFLDKPEKLKELLEKTETSLEKAKGLTKQLLTFSKGGAPIKELTSIESCIKESVDFVLSGSNIKVHYDFEENLQNVEIDQGQISQVFQNLALNAKEAMPTGGDIFVSIKNFRSDNSDKFLLSGNYIEITFKDTGIGIDREILPHIFEPFFTTKESGSGLGLATCFSIIKNHDGFIKVDSEKGMGTVFKIYLPATDKKIEKKQISDFLDEKITDKEISVLLMDDNDEICELAKDIFAMMNCKTDIVYDGKEAVEKYSNALKKGRKYDIVILDLTVPGGMGGKEAVKQLIDIDPNVKAVVSSGYSNDPVIQNYKKFGFEYVLVKPYTISQVEKMIKSLI